MSDADPDSLPLLDDEAITELRDIMEDEFAELLNAFLNDLPAQIARLQTVATQGDADELYQIAHKLKSSCGSIGAPRLTELIRRLEQAGRQKVLDGATPLLRQVETVAGETIAGLRARLD
ncbi:MAG: Hpt domain-containing protein [Candidatus Contendobacter sp.]|nr:MAG: Hpt domain-containing protein [Candidatus Contendobacter sp.]